MVFALMFWLGGYLGGIRFFQRKDSLDSFKGFVRIFQRKTKPNFWVEGFIKRFCYIPGNLQCLPLGHSNTHT